MTTRILAFAALMLLAVSCGTTTTQLYSWGKNANTGVGQVSSYESATYDFYKKHDEKSIVDLAKTYEYMVTHPGGARKVVPPGVCAEYGFFLMQPEVTAALASSKEEKFHLSPEAFKNKGIALLEQEITLYPEAATLLKPLIKRARE